MASVAAEQRFDDSALVAAVADAGLAGAVALIGGRGGIRYQRAFGVADIASGTPMTTGHVFQIASMTKAITSVAALQLVERGHLSLDAPLAPLLPVLGAVQVLDGFADTDGGDGSPRLRPPATPVTLRHLLTHTSGLGYDFINADQLRARGPEGPPAPGTLAAITTPLLFDPGTRWEYGVGTDWVGLAIEAASGMPLGDYFTANIFAPLAMTDTAFRPDLAGEPRATTVYARTPDDALAAVPMVLGDGEFQAGGAGLSSTAADYYRFLAMVLNGGTLDGATILSPLMVGELSRNQVGDLPAGRMASTMPEFAPPYDGFPGIDCGWTLGFLHLPVAGPNGRRAGSLSWAGIFNCYYWADPNADVIGIFMAQLMPFGDERTLAAVAALEHLAYDIAV